MRVGYWQNPSGTDAGRAEVKAARGDITNEEVDALVDYIGAAEVETSWRGWANCRACNEHLGSQCMKSPDGRFVFPSKYEHYILMHIVRPPEEFVESAMLWSRTNKGNQNE